MCKTLCMMQSSCHEYFFLRTIFVFCFVSINFKQYEQPQKEVPANSEVLKALLGLIFLWNWLESLDSDFWVLSQAETTYYKRLREIWNQNKHNATRYLMCAIISCSRFKAALIYKPWILSFEKVSCIIQAILRHKLQHFFPVFFMDLEIATFFPLLIDWRDLAL